MYVWPLVVQRAAYGQTATFDNVGVDHGGFDALVAEEFLHRADVVTVFEQVRGIGSKDGALPRRRGTFPPSALQTGQANWLRIRLSSHSLV